MDSRGVSTLKFVGTVSLGLLTGLSYTLSTLTVPTLLTLPSAGTAARAFDSLASSARKQLRTLASASGSAFLLAFFLSPRPSRHPYLLYTSLLVAGSGLATSDLVAPYLSWGSGAAPSSASSSLSSRSATRKPRREPASSARMEASYEVLGSGSDAHSEGTSAASDEGEDAADHPRELNGEEVRTEVEDFLKKQVIQTAVAGLAFVMSVVGIWGDGAGAPASGDVYIVGV